MRISDWSSDVCSSDLLTQQMFGPLGERYQEYSASILESGRHLLAVINDILDLSKVEAGHYELDEGLVDVGDIADQVCGLLREQGAAARLSMKVQAGDRKSTRLNSSH